MQTPSNAKKYLERQSAESQEIVTESLFAVKES